MKAIILAAGEGTRLRPHTYSKPKCMVEIHGRPLLDWQLSVMRLLGINDIIVITGYMRQHIHSDNVRFYHNELYAVTNMVETLWCAREEFEDDFIISYGDIIYEPKVLQAIIDSRYEISVVVDKEWHSYWQLRFDNPCVDAESLKIDGEGKIVSIGQKISDISEAQAQYIGLMRFSGKGREALQTVYRRAKELSKTVPNPLNPGRPFEKMYMTDLLQGLVNAGYKVMPVPVHRGWFEIDSVSDLELAVSLSDVDASGILKISR